MAELVDRQHYIAAPRQLQRAKGGSRFFIALVTMQGQQPRRGMLDRRRQRAIQLGDHGLQFLGHKYHGVDVHPAKITLNAVPQPGRAKREEGQQGR